MNFYFILAICLAAGLYILLNYYIGRKGWKIIKQYTTIKAIRWIYWIIFWVLAFSYFSGRISVIPGVISNFLWRIGEYWLAFLLYILLIVCLIDIVRFSGKRFKPLKNLKKYKHTPLVTGLAVILTACAIVVYGIINAANPIIQRYEVSVDKKADIKSLHVAMASDMHINPYRGKAEIDRFIKQVDEISPDVLFLDGDIIVEDTDVLTGVYLADSLSKLKLKYGIYAVTGNHEYIGGVADYYEELLTSAGVKVLRDNVAQIENSIYIVGREDRSMDMYNNKKRNPLAQLLNGADKSKPIIVLDHQPYSIEEAEKNNIDVQLSGHTHKGQMFPFTLITSLTYKLDWGIMKENGYNLIVSSGYGTWGPPIRTGNTPEIIDLEINFK